MSNPINVAGAESFEQEVIKSELPVLVDFWAAWCGPCQMMTPVIEKIAQKYDGKLKVVKIDTEVPENQKIAIDYNIQGIPNMKLFKKGSVVKEYVGFRPEETLVAELQNEIE